LAQTDWKKVEIVEDVPEEAQTIYIGLYLRGAGKLWMDGARIDLVATDVPTTDDQRWHSWSYSSPHYTLCERSCRAAQWASHVADFFDKISGGANGVPGIIMIDIPRNTSANA